ncbi:uncharacterized protein LOC8289699 isoform X2 [Ricinus communis]|uniref:uncharacterized protein LOC8289699 isoform X2 n=1 Tax=Ricinus communis TaxID=3988 RepID=UPI0007723D85|nr:uncharacterized protein LOC8289699 isoform X2 [Ricinus communis]|eukprot:XP_015582723.1 uncharacterized protein LOC8289699 [Ricinus communis]
MSVSKPTSVIAPPLPSTYDVEYRAIADDAWYSVRTVVEGETLRIKYENFGDEHDSVFEPQNFKCAEEIEIFEKRFRPLSNQLQDKECKKLSVGTVVCASHSFTNLDNRFYDGVVDDVISRDHRFANGDEQCMCTFVVVWRHGPIAGCLSNKKIENVCVVQSTSQLDPKVATFLKMVRDKLESESENESKPYLPCHSHTPHQDIASLPLKLESTFIEQKRKCASHSQSFSNSWTSEERISDHAQRIKEEVDVGGIGNRYIFLVDNLDKSLSPSTIMEFIHRLTLVSVRAYVFPSLSSETYTNGAVVVEGEKNFQKLSEFFDSPDHIIMSRGGRPWAITAKLSGHDTYLVALGNLMPKYQEKLDFRNNDTGKDLKVVCSGSEEYKTGKQLRDLFLEFAEHQRRLHKRLALEERKIFQSM